MNKQKVTAEEARGETGICGRRSRRETLCQVRRGAWSRNRFAHEARQDLASDAVLNAERWEPSRAELPPERDARSIPARLTIKRVHTAPDKP